MPGRVLIVDAAATNRIVMRVKLASAFLDSDQAASGAEALVRLRGGGITLVVIASDLPDMAGTDLCRAIRRLYSADALPVVIVSSKSDPVLRLRALRLGADEVLERPLDEPLLLARLRCLLRAADGHDDLRLREGSHRATGLADAAPVFDCPAHIVLIGAPERAKPLAALLGQCLPHRITQTAGTDLLRTLPGDGVPDLALVLLDGRAGDSAVSLIAGLRAQPETRRMPVMALLPRPDAGLAADVLDVGVNDLLAGRWEAEELSLRIARLLRRKRRDDRLRSQLHDGLRAAVTDPLTGLYNRRYGLPQLERMAQEAQARGTGLAVMLADIDHFKTVNDRFGHATGDTVLAEVAARLRMPLATTDLLARIGGEEFLIVRTGLSLPEAQSAADSLRRAVADRPFTVPDIPAPLRITISVGLAYGQGGQRDALRPDRMMSQADRALYSAKTCGRNRVTQDQPAA